MENDHKDIRNKMAKFNEWEARYRNNLNSLSRIKQFLALYEFGQMHSNDTLRQMHKEHLIGLIQTVKKLRKMTNSGILKQLPELPGQKK